MSQPRTFVNSPLARIARLVLGRAPRVAMVLGQTVHLSGASREEFLADAEWVAHEEVHLRQVRDLGTLRFLYKYLVESARVGYYQNKFEVEAREGARHHMLARAAGKASESKQGLAAS
ncbi:hypothetical protein GCM10023172_26740 [Hymenobacter ginsengisoli]|uniref:DUF4157 domain-containing protein n=1 Tax=Hymenobacter ginsengisoli TaxID=1051626 RepID=A0ABP8QG29_9BACT|nr:MULTISPECIES: hypothetical protein [unclassified Hymenobacter]MBO2030068.1 hypothetical protein [Hymenobacter sp. BT559]